MTDPRRTARGGCRRARTARRRCRRPGGARSRRRARRAGPRASMTQRCGSRATIANAGGTAAASTGREKITVTRRGVAWRSSLHRPHRDEAPLADQRDALADAIHFRQHVRRQEDRRAPAPRQLADRFAERLDHQRIEAGSRLVEDQHRRVGHQRLDQPDLALHAVRVVAHAAAQVAIAEVEAAEQELEVAPRRRLRPPSARQVRRDSRRRSDPGRTASRSAGSRRGGGPRATARRQSNPRIDAEPRGRPQQIEQQPDRRRLARAVGAEEAEHLAAPAPRARDPRRRLIEP